MNQAAIQAKVNLGYGRAASFLGALCKQYRPIDPMDPLGNQLGTILADFDIDPLFSHKAPSGYGKPIYYGLFDATNVQAGDYLIGPDGSTYAVAGMEPNKPPLCVACNQVVDFLRPSPQPAGSRFYGGDIRGRGEDTILSGWPVSALQGVRGEKGVTNLPGDTRMPWINVLLPSLSVGDVVLQQGDRMSDNLGRFWSVSGVELTNLGWRLTAILADT